MPIRTTKTYAFDISEVICSLFDKESENYKYDLEDVDATAFFTGFSLAFGVVYNRLSDSKIENPFDITGLQNKLLFQHFLEEEKQEGK